MEKFFVSEEKSFIGSATVTRPTTLDVKVMDGSHNYSNLEDQFDELWF